MGKSIHFSGNTYNRGNMNNRDHHSNSNSIKYNNVDGSPRQLEVTTRLEEQQTKRQEILQHFTADFVEKHKHCYLFNGVIEELIKGANPYTIIQQLIEHKVNINNNQKLNSSG